jgi:hypothetical protein
MTDITTDPTSNNINVTSSIPKRKEEDVYDRQIRLWGADAQVRVCFCSSLYK